MEEEKKERGRANELAEAVHEFWSFLLGEDATQPVPLEHDAAGSGAQIELSAPSPDSITVTTEFGVMQEPNHFAVIVSTAAAAHQSPPSGDEDDDEVGEANNHDGLQTLQSAIEAIQQVFDTTAPPAALDVHMELQAADMADDEGHDGDLDEDDFDAESALIDEFIDDGVLTPVTATTNEAS